MTLSPRASITAVHGYLPPDLLTNAELARLVDTSDAWITERTGICTILLFKLETTYCYHRGKISRAYNGALSAAWQCEFTLKTQTVKPIPTGQEFHGVWG